jgi:hypothetical protein
MSASESTCSWHLWMSSEVLLISGKTANRETDNSTIIIFFKKRLQNCGRFFNSYTEAYFEPDLL